MAGFASKRQAAWDKFSDPWLGINGWSNVMTKEEALKLALEALQLSAVTVDNFGVQKKTNEAITAIKEALAQPEQSAEPVELLKKADVFAMAVTHGIDANTKGLYGFYIDCMSTTPSKREWVGLTDEEIDEIDEITWDSEYQLWGIHDFARALEAKLKEKNT